MKEVTIRISGESGEGIVSTGDILSKCLARLGLEVNSFKTYPPSMRSGYVSYQIRVSGKAVLPQREKVDILIAFDDRSLVENRSRVKENGLVIVDSNKLTEAKGVLNIPFGEKASHEAGDIRTKNVIAVGIASSILSIPIDAVKGLISEKFARKGEQLVAKNIKALEIGYEAVNKENYAFQIVQAVEKAGGGEKNEKNRKLLLSGNESIAMGSLTAGLKIYAGYPITPATEIMEFLASELPRAGGKILQTEDEISALGVAIGASFAGEKAMTATSGPGLSLMSELIGLASMTEVPVVIINVQRGGPSTGMPTKVEQGDLNIALHGTHGDSQVVLLCPSNVEDCFYQTLTAFAIAEKFQLPVIVLSDQSLGQRKETIAQPDWKRFMVNIKRQKEEWTDYKRYKITESGISPKAIPGDGKGFYVAQGLEHDEYSVPSNDPNVRINMVNKRFRKLENVLPFLEELRVCEKATSPNSKAWNYISTFGYSDPDIGILGWGSSEGAVREAVIEANKIGLKTAYFYPKILNPLPENEIRAFIKSAKKILVPELNKSGQFANLIQSRFLIPVSRLNKYDGLPFYTEEILKAIKEEAVNCGESVTLKL